jgi:hypothetical protein
MAVPREPTCLPKRMKKRRNQASVRHQTNDNDIDVEANPTKKLIVGQMPWNLKRTQDTNYRTVPYVCLSALAFAPESSTSVRKVIDADASNGAPSS